VALEKKENGQEDKMTLKKTNDAESKTIPAIIADNKETLRLEQFDFWGLKSVPHIFA
jgi:hypothetical protein